MHAAYYRPGKSTSTLPDGLLQQILAFTGGCQNTLVEISGTLSENSIWKKRLAYLGSYGSTEAISWGLTGVMLRCTGVKRDIRFNKRTTYGSYYFSNNRSFVTNNGDALDRYLLRMQEMSESLLIITKNIVKSDRLGNVDNFLNLRDMWLNFSKTQKKAPSMEAMIKHFQK
jgi:NADH:ubiquinone oxidoreductase subunit D